MEGYFAKWKHIKVTLLLYIFIISNIWVSFIERQYMSPSLFIWKCHGFCNLYSQPEQMFLFLEIDIETHRNINANDYIILRNILKHNPEPIP